MRQTHGWDFGDRCYEAEEVIKVLMRWQKQCRMDLIGADASSVKLILNTLPDDLVGFADEVNLLCPELDQINSALGFYGDGPGENRVVAEKLAAYLRETRRLSLWWD